MITAISTMPASLKPRTAIPPLDTSERSPRSGGRSMCGSDYSGTSDAIIDTMKTTVAIDVDAIRGDFPALALEQDGRPVVFLDGPGGTQVPQRVIDAVAAYYRSA